MPYQKELKAVRLLQERSEMIEGKHHDIAGDLVTLREDLAILTGASLDGTPDALQLKESVLAQWSVQRPLP